jgi:hypothetical protein
MNVNGMGESAREISGKYSTPNDPRSVRETPISANCSFIRPS